MGEINQQFIDQWNEGVIAAIEVGWLTSSANRIGIDPLPPNASPRAYNNAMAVVGAGSAIPTKRPGCAVLNRTALGSAIVGQFAYRHTHPTTGVITQYLLGVTEAGGLVRIDELGTVTTISASAFTPGFVIPDFAQLNNLAFMVNGTEAKKMRGTTLENLGITRPTIGNPQLNAGAAGGMTGTFQLRVTYINSNTGHESSASDTAADEATLTGQQLQITNLPSSSDPQVDQVAIYLRETGSQPYFYRADIISNGTTSVTINVNPVNLTVQAPDTAENDPPPSGVKFAAAHKNRLFLADDNKIYYSKVGEPEAFDPEAFDPVQQDDGQKIRGLASLPGGILVIMKEDSFYILEGDTPQSWSIQRAGPNVGCLSHSSIVLANDALYWWAEQGPVRWAFSAAEVPELIGDNLISAVIAMANLNFEQRTKISGAYDITGTRVLFSIPDTTQTRNTKLLPWSTKLQRWESDRWDPIDAASLAVANNSREEPFVMIGSYNGQFFRLGDGNVDGVAEGTTSGTFTASGTSVATITDAGASFDTTGAGLIERKVTILAADGTVLTTSLRPRITSNTGTAITLSTAVGGLTDGATYTYIVGGPDWVFDTAWLDMGNPFHKKRVEFLYVQALLDSGVMYIDRHRNQRDRTLTFDRFATLPSGTLGWDEADWDELIWDDADVTYARLRVGATGISFAWRFRNPFPNQGMTLLKMGMRAEMLRDKLG